MCYRMFSKTWPERSRRLFSLFDPVIQRVFAFLHLKDDLVVLYTVNFLFDVKKIHLKDELVVFYSQLLCLMSTKICAVNQ